MRAIAASDFIAGVEESPDCTERGAPLKRGVLQTIFCGKTSATESRPPEATPVRVKGWGKSPPGGNESSAAW